MIKLSKVNNKIITTITKIKITTKILLKYYRITIEIISFYVSRNNDNNYQINYKRYNPNKYNLTINSISTRHNLN